MIGLSASAALRKNCFTAASLYFCCVSTAISTSDAWRMMSARCQLTGASESMSGVSNNSKRGGIAAPVRQNKRCSGVSASGSSAACQRRNSNPVKSRASAVSSLKSSGTRQTGCRVPAASGLTALAISPAR